MHQAVPPPQRGATYSGYHTRRTPDQDTTLTHVGPGTPMGELMRRYWQPVARSADLGKRPLRLTILGEDLVLFRDGSGRLGLMHRHCTHRGAGLELGRIVDRGIQCSLHGWWFDIDGSVLDTPAEPKHSPLIKTTTQGAYPVQETAGLIFAYLGPPEHQPAFPNLDAFHLPGTELVSYSLHYPCNWLQVHENLMDPLHAVFLHTRMGSTQITDAWGEMPITEYGEEGDRMYYLTSRRFGDNVWVRFNEVSVPNFGQVAGFWQDGAQELLFQRIAATRWTVPHDDTSCTIFGVRHFSDDVEGPTGLGDRNRVGHDSLDVYGQSHGGRTLEQMQDDPGDWEAIVSMGSVAVQSAEHRGTSDVGVVRLRRQLRRYADELQAGTSPRPHRKAAADGIVPTWTSNTVLRIPPRSDYPDDELLRQVGRAVRDAVLAADELAGQARIDTIHARLRAAAHELSAPRSLASENPKG